MTFKQTMDDLNWLMSSREMPHEMCLKLRRYFHETRELNRRRAETQITEQMSPMLQGEFAWFSHSTWIEKVWYLRNMPHDVIVFMSRQLKMSAYSPNEEVFSDRTLVIIRRGVCALAGRILVSGFIWGEDMLLSNEHLRSKNYARSLSYSLLLKLHVEDMANILVEFPEARASLKWAQVQIAIIRAVKKIAQGIHELKKAGGVERCAMSDEERLKFFEDILQGKFQNVSSSSSPVDCHSEDSVCKRRSRAEPTWHSLKPCTSSSTYSSNSSRCRMEPLVDFDAKFEELSRSLAAVNDKVDKLLATSETKTTYSRCAAKTDLGPLVLSATPIQGSSRLLGNPKNLAGKTV